MGRVVARLFGGLGNQLFQYATSRAVASRTGAELLLDTRETDARGRHWRFALDHFAIAGRVAADDELPPPRSRHLAYAWWRYSGTAPRFLRENGLGVNRRVLVAVPDVYLHGYFQSEAYFADIADTIREDFRITTPPSAENRDWLSHIGAVPSVSLHVRRGDYLSSKGSHAVCDAAYYERALAHLTERMEAPVVFVFSDDPEWARANLSLPVETHVAAHNDAAHHYEDLRLMRACRHNIAANSTFSWWGAWLNSDPDKIVVAPRAWFGKAKLKNPDLIPSSWIQL